MLVLNRDKARIFRITHIDNLRWAILNGLHCKNSPSQDPDYRGIGNPDIISKRAGHSIPIDPGGTLHDYIPFYFTPFSPMLYNIKTGYSGLPKIPMEEIVILVANLNSLLAGGHTWIFSDRHALLQVAEFHSALEKLDRIDWAKLQCKDFRRDPNDPGGIERYQAEALIHRFLPIQALSGIVCYGPDQQKKLQLQLEAGAVQLRVEPRPDWYF
ncbi:MAG: DUF4433 domain-containing protein [Fibrobacteria bacterium]